MPEQLPFSYDCVIDACGETHAYHIDGFTGGQVVNVWSPDDWIAGNMGHLNGATNIVSAENPHPGFWGSPITHGHSQIRDAVGAFAALNVNGDANAYYEGSH